jgi:hypothetical protein
MYALSKKNAQKQIRDLFPPRRQRHLQWDCNVVFSKLEERFVPWAIACPASFPELNTSAVYFTHSLPSVTPVTDLVYGTDKELSWEVRGTARTCIERNLKARGLQMVCQSILLAKLDLTDTRIISRRADRCLHECDLFLRRKQQTKRIDVVSSKGSCVV